MIEIILYNCISSRNTINKNLKVLETFTDENFNQYFDKTNPVITISLKKVASSKFALANRCNYARVRINTSGTIVDDMIRYYFAKVTLKENDLLELSMHVDVLEQARDPILYNTQSFFKLRRISEEDYYNPQIIDNLLNLDVERDITYTPIGTSNFSYQGEGYRIAINYVEGRKS